jgi:N-terminal acetyltransferase B complex non-catalytic subunit
LINAFKVLRYIIPPSEKFVETELRRVGEYTRCYFEGLPFGVGLSPTDLQPADDLLLLAGNAYINLWKLTGDENNLLNAVYLLELGVAKSKPSFQARLILIRIYRLLGMFAGLRITTIVILPTLGAPSAALEHYRVLQIKQIQHDTLSHLILSRALTYSLASIGDLSLSSECLEATQIYLSNSQEVR